jgi:hypothetical protein
MRALCRRGARAVYLLLGAAEKDQHLSIMPLRHYYNHKDYEKQEQRRRTERDLEGTDLTLLEASLAGLGWGALWASGTGGKLLRRTMARLPESAGFACLAGAVAGALTATGLWAARRNIRSLNTLHDFLFGGAAFNTSPLY